MTAEQVKNELDKETNEVTVLTEVAPKKKE